MKGISVAARLFGRGQARIKMAVKDGKALSLKGASLAADFLQVGPAFEVPLPPDNAVKLWIRESTEYIDEARQPHDPIPSPQSPSEHCCFES